MRGAGIYLVGTIGLAALGVILGGVSLGAGQAIGGSVEADLNRADPFMFTANALPPSPLGRTRTAEGLTYEQATDLRARLLPDARMAMAGFQRVLGEATVSLPDGTTRIIKASVPYVNVDDLYFSLMGLPLQSGRVFTPDEVSSGAHVVVLGAARSDAGYDPGRNMNTAYEIIGQLCPVSGAAFPLPPSWRGEFPDVDDIVFTPATELAPTPSFVQTGTTIPLVAPRPENASAVMQAVSDYFRELWPDWAVEFGVGNETTVTLVQVQREVSALVWYVTGSLALLLTTSIIGLLVLLVTRNRRPLALRRALGATRAGIVLSCGATGACLTLAGAGLGLGTLVAFLPSLPRVIGEGIVVPWRVVGPLVAVVVASSGIAAALTGLAATSAMPGGAARHGTTARGPHPFDVRVLISFLAIVVGTATVTVLLTTGRASLTSLQRYLRGMGDRTIVVLQDPFLAGSLSPEEWLGSASAGAVRGLLPPDWAIACIGTARATLEPNLPLATAVLVSGIDRPWSGGDAAFEVETGRELTWEDSREGRRVAIVGNALARHLYGAESPIGRTLHTAAGVDLEIVGVLRPRPEGVVDRSGDRNWGVLVPYSLLASVSDVPLNVGSTELWLEFPEGTAVAQALERTTLALAGLQTRFAGLKAEAVINEVSTLSRLRGRMTDFQLVVAYAALFATAWMMAGTIQTRVSERRREIGIKRALGARRMRVGFEILKESLALSLGGGAVGVIAGAMVGVRLCRGEGWAPVGVLGSALTVLAILLGVALLAAVWPAAAAAAEEPMVALREGDSA